MHFLVFTTGEMWFWIIWAAVTVIGAAALGYLTGERTGRLAERRRQGTRDAEDWPRQPANDAVANTGDGRDRPEPDEVSAETRGRSTTREGAAPQGGWPIDSRKTPRSASAQASG
ncbi:hypothetical protein ACQPZP_06095 [Spirillospora sp. CA-142024]|uniref:hypothetical protein n=1 Tax=Spirillospora sp. CA-142024 TaxID=3240036 RepID=UPI003D8DC111